MDAGTATARVTDCEGKQKERRRAVSAHFAFRAGVALRLTNSAEALQQSAMSFHAQIPVAAGAPAHGARAGSSRVLTGPVAGTNVVERA
jgi:hypothetical protein